MPRGGKREGSGRKPLAPDIKRITVSLSPEQADAMTELGGGNASEGIRKAIEMNSKIEVWTTENLYRHLTLVDNAKSTDEAVAAMYQQNAELGKRSALSIDFVDVYGHRQKAVPINATERHAVLVVLPGHSGGGGSVAGVPLWMIVDALNSGEPIDQKAINAEIHPHITR